MGVVVSQVNGPKKTFCSGGFSLPLVFWGPPGECGIPWNQAVSPPQVIRKGTDEGDLYWGHLPPGFFRPCGARKCSQRKLPFDKIPQIKFLDLAI